MILFEVSRVLGKGSQELALREIYSIQRQRKKSRKLIPALIKETTVYHVLTLNRNEELIPDITGKTKVDRFFIPLTEVEEKKLTRKPKHDNGISKAIARAVHNTLQEWQIEDSVRAICFRQDSIKHKAFSGNFYHSLASFRKTSSAIPLQ